MTQTYYVGLDVHKETISIAHAHGGSRAGSALQHTPNPSWITLSQTNMWGDTAAFYGWGFSQTWANGTYQWDIEVRWRTVGEAGNGEVLGNRTQLHTLHDSTGLRRRRYESRFGGHQDDAEQVGFFY